MLIGLISDTHVTKKRGELPEEVFKIFNGADLIIHAGDITQKKVIDELESVAPVIAVLGNKDKLDLNETEIIEAKNFKIAVNHGSDYSDDFDRLYRFAVKLDANILITGHTHKPHFKIIDDILLVNPGTSNSSKASPSLALLTIDENCKSVHDIEVSFIEL